ncbi:hypothetical protein AB0C13_14955 [Streptomyces sp. NPDC049099]|uniref:hypothetical protein n=1 Tax=Streptomyces sp. NPDC049099 TaxID=3155768 RepID=UPI0034235783
MFTEIKPGHADALRKDLAAMADVADDERVHAAVRQIGTLHDARHVIFDKVFSHSVGFPGVKDPGVKDWFVAHQAPAGVSSAPIPI